MSLGPYRSDAPPFAPPANPGPSKAELRRILEEAVRNTAAMQPPKVRELAPARPRRTSEARR